MYSFEIDDRLKRSHFVLTQEELEEIRECSPQLIHVKLEELGNISSRYHIGTNDNHSWEIWVSNR